MSPCRVLFICTGNSARSILSEATLNHVGKGRFEAFSAGSHPTGRVHPEAVRQLVAQGVPSQGLASTAWDCFAQTDAPALDIVITVCGNAANEACPVFPGDLLRSHWGLPDPAAVQGAQALSEAFRQAHAVISHRLIALLALPVETMPRDALQRALDHIGALVGDDEIRA